MVARSGADEPLAGSSALALVSGDNAGATSLVSVIEDAPGGLGVAMRRVVVRLPPAHRDALDALRKRLRREEDLEVSRADLVRFFASCGLAALDPMRPMSNQLPARALKRPPLPAVGKRAKEAGPSLRERIVTRIHASPGEVFTPAKLTPLVDARSRDSVRNTLLVLHARGQVEKVGPGEYRAPAPSSARRRSHDQRAEEHPTRRASSS